MNLPFTLQGRVTDCIQLTYRTPAASVQALLPDGLELAVRGPWAFWNVMCCRVQKLRPAGLPSACGLSYHHVAYRLLAQAMNDRAEVVRGLYFVRSDVDARAVSMLGNKLTDLRIHPASITHDADDCRINYKANPTTPGEARLHIEASHTPARLTKGSCFPTVEDARQFCRYTPNGLAVVERDGHRQLRTTRVTRSDNAWTQTPLAIHACDIAYFNCIAQADHAKLEWACRLGPMDYQWQVGQTTRLLTQRAAQDTPAQLVG